MIIEFCFILLLYQIVGDCVLQYDRVLFKRKTERFTLLEQFVFSLIFGILINTIFTVFVVYIGPFDFILLILFDFLFLIITFVVNKRSFDGFFYWRVFITIKNRKRSQISLRYYKKFFLFFIGIILLDLYIGTFTYVLSFVDLYTHSHYALDSIKHGWNFYDPYYLVDISRFHTIQIFTFTLIPFYAIDPSEWLYISGILLSKLQFYLFFTLIFVILYKFNSKFNIIVVFFISIAVVIFPSWFTYFLPSNFAIVLFLALVVLLFHKNKKSIFLDGFLFIFTLIMHIPSMIAIFSIPLIITLIINWIKSPESLFLEYKRRKNKLVTFIKKYRRIILVGVIFLIISIILLIALRFSFFMNIINSYINLDKNIDATFYPTLYFWEEFTIGLYFNIIILICLLYLFYKKEIKKSKYLVLFFFLLNVYLTIYLLNFDFWNNIIKILYSEYRFALYLDVSLMILIPILVSIIKNYTKFLNKKEFYIKKKLISINNYLMHFNLNPLNLYNKIKIYLRKRKINLHRYLNFSNLAYATIILTILLFCMVKAIPNYNKRYYREPFEEISVDATHDYTFTFLENYAFDYQTYMYYPEYEWPKVHIYLEELRCIDLRQINPYYDDSKYEANNSEYQDYLDFIFNETKVIYYKQASYKYDYLRFTKRVDYIVIDDFANPKLCNLMMNDTAHFQKIFQCAIKSPLITLKSYIKNYELPRFVYIFKTKPK